MALDPHAIKIFVDGSALPKNPGRAGFAAWIEYPDSWEMDSKEITLSNNTFEQSTNQRMELLACIWAHEWVRENIVSGEIQRIQIITDSRYVFENRNRPQLWRSQGWRSADGRPIENDTSGRPSFPFVTRCRLEQISFGHSEKDQSS